MRLFGDDDENELRINDDVAISLKTTAGVLDFFSVVPILNVFVALIGWPIIMFLFHLNKVPVLRARAIWELTFGFIIEMIPVVSIIPTYFLFTKFLINHSQNEDRDRAERRRSGTAAKRTSIFTG